MNCETCAGACCEEFSLPGVDVRPPGPDERRWLELHGTRTGADVRFECRCTALTADGRCSIYSSRPMVCVTFEAGGKDCLDTVKRRRTPEQYAAIRGAGDPERIHEHEEPTQIFLGRHIAMDSHEVEVAYEEAWAPVFPGTT